MKTNALLFAIFFCSCSIFAQQPTSLLSDFDGTTSTGFSTSVWSYTFTAKTVANPLPSGINTSANVLSFPAHYFLETTWWYYQGGVLQLKVVPSSFINNNAYLYFDMLVIQDTVKIADTLSITAKFSVGGTAYTTPILKKIPVAIGGPNVWQSITLPIPSAILPSTHTQIDLTITNNNNKFVATKNRSIAVYYDNFGFTNTAVITGINNTSADNGIIINILKNQINIKMQKLTPIMNAKIFSVNGAQLYQKSINSITNDISLPINLQSGIYVLKIASKEQSYTQKFVVK